MAHFMNDYDVPQALRALIAVLNETNAYFSQQEPWKLRKSNTPEHRKQADKVVYITYESLRICSVLLEPFVPSLANRALHFLAASHDLGMYTLCWSRDFSSLPLIPDADKPLPSKWKVTRYGAATECYAFRPPPASPLMPKLELKKS